MSAIPVHETSVRAIVPLEGKGDVVMCGLPGLCISFDGGAYFDPEHAALTFDYLAELDVAVIYLFMEDFELPKMAKHLINEGAQSHSISVVWIPIVDYGKPDDTAEDIWKEGRTARADWLTGEQSIAVTCLYGAGRSGMMAAAIAAENGEDAEAAVRYVRHHFEDAVGSPEQERWVSHGSYLS